MLLRAPAQQRAIPSGPPQAGCSKRVASSERPERAVPHGLPPASAPDGVSRASRSERVIPSEPSRAGCPAPCQAPQRKAGFHQGKPAQKEASAIMAHIEPQSTRQPRPCYELARQTHEARVRTSAKNAAARCASEGCKHIPNVQAKAAGTSQTCKRKLQAFCSHAKRLGKACMKNLRNLREIRVLIPARVKV